MSKKKLPHNWTRAKKGSHFHWQWCRHCGLVRLNNEKSRKLARQACPDREE